ncbi:tetratricopeptide repeat protein [Entomospira culicis]|uniref:Tetratricopeptide repeat protein n=1 Tax=Entomospira culicis TaxID=2719989 RepID=A0A968GH26_9SPIO|nr:tetratricopeptide repeat protein [Entomospira culicis]NIZ18649.1 tetratricopeptide repeat protein [Entomospira culicis]NIZ68864.1 tetratricopeptide repeat protein [Entomospira culicis]WDI37458.1 tetratricopeptide repeat protein [Entomospira culicis]WDI39086.1 tetratricopeptide repeat protein [Entomospira culicis]
MRRAWFIALIWNSVVLMSGFANEPIEPIERIELAREAYRAGNYAQADRLYRDVVRFAPDVARYRFEHGMVYVALKRWTMAKSSMERAIALDPEHLLAHYNLAQIHLQMRKPALAKASYQRAIALRPDFVPAYINLANLLLKEKAYDEAQALYQAVVALDLGVADAYLGIAISAFYLDDFVMAEEYIEQFILQRPRDARGLHWQKIIADALQTPAMEDEINN